MDTPSPVDVAVSTALAKERTATDIESIKRAFLNNLFYSYGQDD